MRVRVVDARGAGKGSGVECWMASGGWRVSGVECGMRNAECAWVVWTRGGLVEAACQKVVVRLPWRQRLSRSSAPTASRPPPAAHRLWLWLWFKGEARFAEVAQEPLLSCRRELRLLGCHCSSRSIHLSPCIFPPHTHTHTMHAVRSAARAASQFRPTPLPRFVRAYSSPTAYEHLLVSTPRPGVGLGTFALLPF